MTSKIFRALAAEFAALKTDPTDYGDNLEMQEAAEDMRRCCARRVASVCAAHKDNFDRGRFLAACEVKE